MLEGVITNYFDITKYCGPHALTISEETTGNSLELTMWDDKWSDELECLTTPPFFTKQVQLTGFVSEYEGEAQIQVCGGVDVVDEMLEASRKNFIEAEAQNPWFKSDFVTLKKGDAMNLPLEDNSIDVAAQNCLFNIFKEEIFSPIIATRNYLTQNNLKKFVL